MHFALKKHTNLDWVVPLLIGVVAFWIVIGPNVLIPTNVKWLLEGDPGSGYLGWVYFRNSDWTFPIGLNPSYGLEISSSIFYSDSGPFALIFKPFASILPEPFQYAGIWLLMCFVLQAWFSWKLIGLITDSRVLRSLACVLFVFAPPMLHRTPMHFTGAAHFLLVAALYLALCPDLKKRILKWGILLAIASTTHAYPFVMVAAIWGADLVKETSLNRNYKRSCFEFFSLVTFVGIVCWQIGYFCVDSSGLNYGTFVHSKRLDLLSLFNSRHWSYVLKPLPVSTYQEAYLGTGTLLLLLFTIPVVWLVKRDLWYQIKKTTYYYA